MRQILKRSLFWENQNENQKQFVFSALNQQLLMPQRA